MPRFRALAVLCALGALLPCTSCGDAQTAPAVPGGGFPGDYGETAARIIGAARTDETVHEQLTYLCDRIGPRPAGSPAYDEAASWAAAEMARDGLDAVRHEPVTIEMWRRGEESALLLEPGGPRPIAVLGLGRSVATPRGGITGEVVPVRGFDELSRLGRAVKGKIVLFNFPMREPSASAYAEAVAYRWTAAARAARRGAVAALVRSVTTRRLGTPHTGVMAYEDDAPEIPAAAITTEDADLIERLHEAGASPVVKLVLAGGPLPPAASANVVGELRGRELPGEIVLAGAHLDSWDVACGAHDNASGVVVALGAARLLRGLDIRPRRTVRVVLFTNEERGLDGARAYLEAHRDEIDRHAAALEHDGGGFAPRGFAVDAGSDALARLAGFVELFRPLGALSLRMGGSGADVSPLVRLGVPGLGLVAENERYFDYHHSAADTLDKVDAGELKESLAAFTLMTWLLAEDPEPLPRVPTS